MKFLAKSFVVSAFVFSSVLSVNARAEEELQANNSQRCPAETPYWNGTKCVATTGKKCRSDQIFDESTNACLCVASSPNWAKEKMCAPPTCLNNQTWDFRTKRCQ